jgi:hypothetical protein
MTQKKQINQGEQMSKKRWGCSRSHEEVDNPEEADKPRRADVEKNDRKI